MSDDPIKISTAQVVVDFPNAEEERARRLRDNALVAFAMKSSGWHGSRKSSGCTTSKPLAMPRSTASTKPRSKR